jgi:hypothetical protein
LAITVLACAVASALAILAASRVWSEVLTHRVDPLPPMTTRRTGSSFAPWLSPLGVVGLASAGALLATRGPARRVVGVLMAVVGAAIAVAALLPLGSGARPLWPVVAAVAGAVVVAAGVATVGAAGSWPAMGARYDRPGQPPPAERKSATQAEMWDALDRGEDPTG